MWPPRQVDAREWAEVPGRPAAQVADNLEDMGRLLRLLAVDRMVWSHLRTIEPPPDRPLRVLDLATGAGWLPRALANAARRESRAVQVVGVDLDHRAVALARARADGDPALEFRQADIRELDPAWGPFDAVLCTMALHHLTDADGDLLLAAMAATATRCWLLCDLLRGPAALLLAWIGTRIASRNPLTRHDGPVSVRRALTLPELEQRVAHAVPSGGRVYRWAGICGVAIGPRQARDTGHPRGSSTTSNVQ